MLTVVDDESQHLILLVAIEHIAYASKSCAMLSCACSTWVGTMCRQNLAPVWFGDKRHFKRILEALSVRLLRYAKKACDKKEILCPQDTGRTLSSTKTLNGSGMKGNLSWAKRLSTPVALDSSQKAPTEASGHFDLLSNEIEARRCSLLPQSAQSEEWGAWGHSIHNLHYRDRQLQELLRFYESSKRCKSKYYSRIIKYY